MFDLNAYMAERRKVIDKALETFLPPVRLRPAILHRAMRHSVFSGGKRIRPILCLAAAEAVGAPFRAALAPAVAVELLHTYTLIHDDLPCMDDDDLRRGKPTCHVAFGEANALLAGDALQALAFEVLASTRLSSPYSTGQLVHEFARAAGSLGVVAGQAEDLAAAPETVTAADVHFIHLRKTAELFRAAMRLGAMAGTASREQLTALTYFAVNVGLAFQLTDDLLDADADRVLKTVGAPRRGSRSRGGPAGKKKPGMSCLAVYSPEEMSRRAEKLVATAIKTLDPCDKKGVEPLKAIAQFILERTS